MSNYCKFYHRAFFEVIILLVISTFNYALTAENKVERRINIAVEDKINNIELDDELGRYLLDEANRLGFKYSTIRDVLLAPYQFRGFGCRETAEKYYLLQKKVHFVSQYKTRPTMNALMAAIVSPETENSEWGNYKSSRSPALNLLVMLPDISGIDINVVAQCYETAKSYHTKTLTIKLLCRLNAEQGLIKARFFLRDPGNSLDAKISLLASIDDYNGKERLGITQAALLSPDHRSSVVLILSAYAKPNGKIAIKHNVNAQQLIEQALEKNEVIRQDLLKLKKRYDPATDLSELLSE